MIRQVTFAVVALALACPDAPAASGHTLPRTARKLTADEIRMLYDRRTFAFENITSSGSLYGISAYDLSRGRNAGRYRLGETVGTFEAQVRVEGDRICYLSAGNPEECSLVYVHGLDVFEVGADGKVKTVLFREAPGAAR
jgi:hypothetical protein